VREEVESGGALTLYELLPEEQANARKDRLERANQSLLIKEFNEIIRGPPETEESWSWDEWVVVKIARLTESRVRSILPVLRESISDLESDTSIVTGSGAGQVFLPETVGVRLVLLFAGIKPIQRVDRMRAFARGIARMGDEECYYWHAKCRSPSSPNGEKALRTLLTDHV
jgi:hypothetical protein